MPKKSKRVKVHREYVFLRACQKHEGYSDEYMGNVLSCSARSYNDKVLGWSDFTSLEGKELSRLFNKSQEFLFA